MRAPKSTWRGCIHPPAFSHSVVSSSFRFCRLDQPACLTRLSFIHPSLLFLTDPTYIHTSVRMCRADLSPPTSPGLSAGYKRHCAGGFADPVASSVSPGRLLPLPTWNIIILTPAHNTTNGAGKKKSLGCRGRYGKIGICRVFLSVNDSSLRQENGDEQHSRPCAEPLRLGRD